MRALKVSDLELFYAGEQGHPFLGLGSEGLKEILKTRAPILTSTPNYLNAIYGPQAWVQINGEAVPFGLTPKTDWDRSGFRVITDLESTYTDLNIGEDDTIPDSVKPDVKIIKPSPKTLVKSFELSDVQEALAELGADDAFGTINQLRQFRAVDFARGISKWFMKDVEAEASGAGADFAQATYTGMCPFDRAISNKFEENIYGGTYNHYYDYYDVNRDYGATPSEWGNCVVVGAGGSPKSDAATLGMGSAAGATSELDDELLRETIALAHKRGGRTTVMLTGWDTYAKLQGVYLTMMRFNEPLLKESMAQFGVNGIKTAMGKDVGLPIATVHGIPLVCTQDAVVDGGSSCISRVLGLDLTDEEGLGFPRLGFSMLRPVEYYESRDYINLNRFVMKGAYRIVGENYLRFYPGQWKIKDII